MKQVYIEFAMRVMHWREKAGAFCGFTLLPSVATIFTNLHNFLEMHNFYSSSGR